MREVKKTALVSYTPRQMFALVENFEQYPQFLPWVSGARLISRTGNELLGELQMQKFGVNERFTTRNTLFPPERMDMQLVDGPFKSLTGIWQFQPLTAADGQVRGTKVLLDIRFEFKNAMLEMLMGKAFEASLNTLVDSFVQRAKSLYG